MADEPHAVVRLLVKRMESHPEEFKSRSEPYYERWATHMEALREYGSEADNAEITAKLRDIRLAEIHEQVMDELLNGPERRRKEEEERQVLQQAMQRNTYAQGGGGAGIPIATSPYQSQLGSYQNAVGAQGIVGKSPTSVIMDEYANIGIGTQSASQSLTVQNGRVEAMRIQANGDIQIGNETLNEGLLKNIKKALKL
jgi:hypothetical protein